jgi:GDP-4-dehydro-6-deoxy-D-mannose reductase
MRSLITGTCGFVGPYLAELLLSKGHEVLGTAKKKSSSANQYPICEGDLLNREFVENLVSDFNPQAVYHLAGLSFLPTAEKDFSLALRANVEITYNLLSVLSQHSRRTQTPIKVILASTSEVYGKVNSLDLPVKECFLPKPLSNYGISKLMMEQLLNRFQSELISIVVARPFNHIGAGQSPQFVTASFASQLAQIKLKKRPPQIKVGNLEVYRDFTDVRDTVKAYLKIMESKCSGTYNISSGCATKIGTILTELQDIAETEVEILIHPEKARPSENPIFYGSHERLNCDTGWLPTITLRETLNEIYKYWLSVESVSST